MNGNQLKDSILQLAIKGKLVKQLCEEGFPGEIEENTKMISSEFPFEIPDSWKWVTLADIGDWGAGATPSRSNPAYFGGDIPWLKTGDLNDDQISETSEYITEEALRNSSVKLKPPGSVLIAMYGATIGKLGILNIESTTNQACCACITNSLVFNKFLFYYLMSQRKSLIKMGSGGAQPNISKTKLINYLFPLPPYKEQVRIVNKIEELLPNISTYSNLHKEITEINQEFPEKLKKSILKYALKGKLTNQKIQESAHVLYKEINDDINLKCLEGKYKKSKILNDINDINDNEIEFDIPVNWKWVRLGNLLYKLTDGTHSTPTYTENGVPFISVKDISSGKINFSHTRFISEHEHQTLFKRCNPEKNDILLTKVGTTGIPVIVDTEKQFSLFVSVALLKFNNSLISNEYLAYAINSPLVQSQVKENTRGVGNKNWVMRDIANTILPLPPYEEQQRIVNTLNQLFKIIDTK